MKNRVRFNIRGASALLAPALLALVLAAVGPVGAQDEGPAKEAEKAVPKTFPTPLEPTGKPTPSKVVPKLPRLSTPPTGLGKVDALVEEIRRARSLAQVRQAYGRLRFGEADDEALARRLSKDSSLTTKLEELGRPEIERRKSARRARLAVPAAKAMRVGGQQQVVKQGSTVARRAFTPPPGIVPRSGGLGGTLAARAFRPPPGVTSQGDIDGVSPVPAVVGEPVVIRGDDFGSRRGEVFFLYEPDRVAFRATVSSWSESRIEVAIPDAVAERVGESRKVFLVRVVPDGVDTGPVHDLLVEPDPARLVPAISRVAPESVLPGQELTLLGRNFLTEATGSVAFVVGGERIPGAVADGDWSDTAVVVRMPSDVTGLVGQEAEVVLENHRGNSGRHSVRFEPLLEEETLFQEWEHDCWGLLGLKQTVTHHDFTLANQWEVVESRLGGDAMGWFGVSTGTGGGCIERHEPTPGSSEPGYRFEGWCNALNIVWCDTWVDIRGPRGTEYR